MNSKTPVLIHVNGGKGVGLGHISRGLGLAQGLVANQCTPLFFLSPRADYGDFLSKKGFEVLNSCLTPLHIRELCDKVQARAVVVDSYSVKINRLKKNLGNIPLVFFHDYGLAPDQLDLLVNGGLGALGMRYQKKKEFILMLVLIQVCIQ